MHVFARLTCQTYKIEHSPLLYFFIQDLRFRLVRQALSCVPAPNSTQTTILSVDRLVEIGSRDEVKNVNILINYLLVYVRLLEDLSFINYIAGEGLQTLGLCWAHIHIWSLAVRFL
jgi:hypothetical protein